MSNGSPDYLMAKVESLGEDVKEVKDSVRDIAAEMKRNNDAMWNKIDGKASKSEVQGLKRLVYTLQTAMGSALAYFGFGAK